MSVVRLRLLMTFVASESRIEGQMQIAVCLIRTGDSAPISEAMTVLQESPDSDPRYEFLSICPRICFGRVLTEIFVASMVMIV
jgi:hypothetical protein